MPFGVMERHTLSMSVSLHICDPLVARAFVDRLDLLGRRDQRLQIDGQSAELRPLRKEGRHLFRQEGRERPADGHRTELVRVEALLERLERLAQNDVRPVDEVLEVRVGLAELMSCDHAGAVRVEDMDLGLRKAGLKLRHPVPDCLVHLDRDGRQEQPRARSRSGVG